MHEEPKNWDKALAAHIDHTLLRPDARRKEIEEHCLEAARYGFAAAVVLPSWVPLARRLLEGSSVKVCSVVAFPLGALAPKEKAVLTESLMAAGADEVDMVMNVGAFLSGDFDLVAEELRAAVSVLGDSAAGKLIIETAYLDEEGIRRASRMGAEAGFDYIKTSTGFAPRGVSLDDVRIISRAVGGRAAVKASGGIRDRDFALALIEAGASRLGCSRSLEVIAL